MPASSYGGCEPYGTTSRVCQLSYHAIQGAVQPAHKFKSQVPQQSHKGSETQSTEEPAGSCAPRLTQQNSETVIVCNFQLTQTFLLELHP